MTIMRRLAVPSIATLALVAGVGFAVAQSGGGASGGGSGSGGGASSGGASSGAGTANMPAQKAVTKPKRSHKTSKRAKRQSTPTKGRPLGPTNTRG